MFSIKITRSSVAGTAAVCTAAVSQQDDTSSSIFSKTGEYRLLGLLFHYFPYHPAHMHGDMIKGGPLPAWSYLLKELGLRVTSQSYDVTRADSKQIEMDHLLQVPRSFFQLKEVRYKEKTNVLVAVTSR